MSNDHNQRPLWVQWAVWGLPSRTAVWAFCWLSVALAVGSVLYGFINPRFFAGIVLLGAAFWYSSAIKWIDTHGRWE